jgi:hypothetical protein
MRTHSISERWAMSFGVATFSTGSLKEYPDCHHCRRGISPYHDVSRISASAVSLYGLPARTAPQFDKSWESYFCLPYVAEQIGLLTPSRAFSASQASTCSLPSCKHSPILPSLIYNTLRQRRLPTSRRWTKDWVGAGHPPLPIGCPNRRSVVCLVARSLSLLKTQCVSSTIGQCLMPFDG